MQSIFKRTIEIDVFINWHEHEKMSSLVLEIKKYMLENIRWPNNFIESIRREKISTQSMMFNEEHFFWLYRIVFFRSVVFRSLTHTHTSNWQSLELDWSRFNLCFVYAV